MTSTVGDVLALAKVRVNVLVVATTAGGYYMARPLRVDPYVLILTCVGTALVAAGAAAINQVDERATDALMARTQGRPVAAGRMTAGMGRGIALFFSVLGVATLALTAGGIAALVAAATLGVYALIYTPLKRRTSVSTIVGAIPGALPPLIGWTAAGGVLDVPAPWALFAIMFIWQLPHFLAIAWIFRDDYTRAGLKMLSVVDPSGGMAGRQATVWAALLVPVSLLPALLHLTEPSYAIGALILGASQFVLAFIFALRRTLHNARMLFYASITYVPMLWALMVWTRR